MDKTEVGIIYQSVNEQLSKRGYMSEEQAFSILTEHRNNITDYCYADRKAASATLKHLVLEWIQCVDGQWQLVKIGYHD
jgi:hypothetical protein